MVWAIDGDGCFQMTAQELVTASAERIPVKVAILNNAYLGMVRQWQHMFYEERYSEVYLSPDLPDYVLWAEAMGCVGLRVDNARGGAAGHREGQLDRRPAGRHRLPHRLDGAGLPDGARRGVERRHRRPPVPAAPDEPRRADRRLTRAGPPPPPVGRSSRTRPACSPASPASSRRRGYNIFSLAVAPTDDERFVADLDRRRRRVRAARADRRPARQAHQRRRDLRAAPDQTPRGRAAARRPCAADAGQRAQVDPARRRVRRPHRRRRPRRAHRDARRRPRTCSTTSRS